MEILYLSINRDDKEGDSTQATGEGTAIGAFAGYKAALDMGFTWEFQFGYQTMIAKAKASDSSSSASASASTSFPLVNLNFGWSF